MKKPSVLIVDDEELVLMALQEAFEDAGYHVSIAHNGNEAVDCVKKEAVDLVFTDLVMPGPNGVQTCEAIKKISPATEIILISGHPEEISKHIAAFVMAGGRDEILRKPIDVDEIVKAADKVVKERGQ